MSSRMVIVAAAAVLCLLALARAELFGPDAFNGRPDICSVLDFDGSGNYVTYGIDPGEFLNGELVEKQGLLAAHGLAQNLALYGVPGTQSTIANGVFELTATVDSSGQALPGEGHLRITGKLDDEVFTLDGDLSQFDTGENTFEFLFNNINIAGSLSSRFCSNSVGVRLTVSEFEYAAYDRSATDAASGAFDGWDRAFYVQNARSDTCAVPAPGAAMLAAIGLGLVSRYRRQIA